MKPYRILFFLWWFLAANSNSDLLIEVGPFASQDACTHWINTIRNDDHVGHYFRISPCYEKQEVNGKRP